MTRLQWDVLYKPIKSRTDAFVLGDYDFQEDGAPAGRLPAIGYAWATRSFGGVTTEGPVVPPPLQQSVPRSMCNSPSKS